MVRGQLRLSEAPAAPAGRSWSCTGSGQSWQSRSTVWPSRPPGTSPQHTWWSEVICNDSSALAAGVYLVIEVHDPSRGKPERYWGTYHAVPATYQNLTGGKYLVLEENPRILSENVWASLLIRPSSREWGDCMGKISLSETLREYSWRLPENLSKYFGWFDQIKHFPQKTVLTNQTKMHVIWGGGELQWVQVHPDLGAGHEVHPLARLGLPWAGRLPHCRLWRVEVSPDRQQVIPR